MARTLTKHLTLLALLASGCAQDAAQDDETSLDGEGQVAEGETDFEQQAAIEDWFPWLRRDGGFPWPTRDAGPTVDAGTPSDAGPAPTDGGGPKTCSNTLTPGDKRISINVGGLNRSYILHVPRSYNGSKAVPLLLDLHPMLFGTGQSQRNSSGYAAISDREGFLVAYPDGVGGAFSTAWNLGPCCTQSRTVDDYGFMLAIVEKTKREGCVDDKRVYAAGYSNGGGLSHYLACKHADVFAAVSPAAFDLIQEVDCKPSRPISVISFRGTSDAIVPYNGGRSTPPTPWRLNPINFLGAQKTFQKWAQLNGCTGTPTSAGKAGCVTYPQCNAGVEVTLCTAQGGGHVTGDAEFGWSRLKQHTLP